MFSFDEVFEEFLNGKASIHRGGTQLFSGVKVIIQSETSKNQRPEQISLIVNNQDKNVTETTHIIYFKRLTDYLFLLGDVLTVTDSIEFNGQYAIVEYAHTQKLAGGLSDIGYTVTNVRFMGAKKIGDSGSNNVGKYRFGDD